MYAIYPRTSSNFPSYTHNSSYVVWKIHPLRPILPLNYRPYLGSMSTLDIISTIWIILLTCIDIAVTIMNTYILFTKTIKPTLLIGRKKERKRKWWRAQCSYFRHTTLKEDMTWKMTHQSITDHFRGIYKRICLKWMKAAKPEDVNMWPVGNDRGDFWAY